MARRRGHNFPRSKRSPAERGYGSSHQDERKRWQRVVDLGAAVCVRCGLPIASGTAYHLDHRDDRLGYLGVSHAICNMRAAAKLGNKRMREKHGLAGSRRVTSRDW